MTPEEIRRRHERAYMQGEQAFRGGKKVTDCPYRTGTMDSERTSWMQGFERAKAARRAGR